MNNPTSQSFNIHAVTVMISIILKKEYNKKKLNITKKYNLIDIIIFFFINIYLNHILNIL